MSNIEAQQPRLWFPQKSMKTKYSTIQFWEESVWWLIVLVWKDLSNIEWWKIEESFKKTLPRAKRQSHKPSSLLAPFLIWVAALWHHQHLLQISWPASTVGITWKFTTRWLIPSPLFTQLSFNLLFCPQFFCYIIVTYLSIFTYFLFLPFWFFSLYWTLQ